MIYDRHLFPLERECAQRNLIRIDITDLYRTSEALTHLLRQDRIAKENAPILRHPLWHR